MNGRCDYAACNRIAHTEVEEWEFCYDHTRDHHRLVAEEAAKERARQELASRVIGHLLPSCSLTPLLEVLHRRPARRAGAA